MDTRAAEMTGITNDIIILTIELFKGPEVGVILCSEQVLINESLCSSVITHCLCQGPGLWRKEADTHWEQESLPLFLSSCPCQCLAICYQNKNRHYFKNYQY